MPFHKAKFSLHPADCVAQRSNEIPVTAVIITSLFKFPNVHSKFVCCGHLQICWDHV